MTATKVLVTTLLITLSFSGSAFNPSTAQVQAEYPVKLSPSDLESPLSPLDSSKRVKKTKKVKKVKAPKFKRPKVSKPTSMRKARQAKTSG